MVVLGHTPSVVWPLFFSPSLSCIVSICVVSVEVSIGVCVQCLLVCLCRVKPFGLDLAQKGAEQGTQAKQQKKSLPCLTCYLLCATANPWETTTDFISATPTESQIVNVSGYGLLRTLPVAQLISSSGMCGTATDSSLGTVLSLDILSDTEVQVEVRGIGQGGFVQLCLGFVGLPPGTLKGAVENPEIVLEGIAPLMATADVMTSIAVFERHAGSELSVCLHVYERGASSMPAWCACLFLEFQ